MKNLQSFLRNVDDEEIIHTNSDNAFLNLFFFIYTNTFKSFIYFKFIYFNFLIFYTYFLKNQ